MVACEQQIGSQLSQCAPPHLLLCVTTKKGHTEFQLDQLSNGGGSKTTLRPPLNALDQGCAELLLDNSCLCVRASQGMIVQVT